MKIVLDTLFLTSAFFIVAGSIQKCDSEGFRPIGNFCHFLLFSQIGIETYMVIEIQLTKSTMTWDIPICPRDNVLGNGSSSTT
jgi:hypothetical protein